ncbi:MAG TPA: hypothetical protein VIM12_10940 [Noviherbaspirillum sp.]|jgi:hypothetical protein|uniref:hypothetical protein n=1 Tax=Noviherbaspirillum sp. TaxID=1926288 RepID=UPI002F91F165
MFLIQILLPLYDNQGRRLPAAVHGMTRDELVGRFGGLTAYTRAPASGLWQEDAGHTVHDELVIYEVMADALDASWWREYRQTLERRYAQAELVVRAHEIVQL